MIIDDLGRALLDLTKRYVICCRVRKVSAHFSMELKELYENALTRTIASIVICCCSLSASFAIGKEMLNFDTFRLFSSSSSRPVSHLSRI